MIMSAPDLLPPDTSDAQLIDELRSRLAQAEDTLGALRSGDVDSLLIHTAQGEKLFVVEGADHVYRMLVETMPEGAASLTSECTVLYANRRLGEMLAVPLTQLFSAPFVDFVAAASVNAFAAACETVGTLHHEVELCRADGTSFPARIALTKLPAGAPAAMSLVVSDLTEDHQRERGERMLDRLVVAISTADDDDGAVQALLGGVSEHFGWHCGQAWLAETGTAPPTRVVGEGNTALSQDSPLGAIISGLVRRCWRSQQQAWAVGPDYAVAIPIMAADEVACVLAFGLAGPRTPEDQQRARLISVAGHQLGSVILRKRAERKLAQAARFFEVASDMVCTARFDGSLVQLNRRWEQTLGWSEAELQSRRFLEWVHPEDVAHTKRELAKLGEGEATVQFLNRYATKAGGWRWLDWVSNAAPAEGLMYASARDVTARVQAEEAVLKAQAETAVAREEAVHASRMAAFLANMSHEIRTPLNGVIGMTELLLDSPLDEEQHENARLLRSSGETLNGVVDDILDFSKMEAGALRLECLEFDLVEAVEDACDLIAARAQGKGVELTMDLASELPNIVCGDPVRIRQVITNLLSNAVKFTSAGEIRVALRTAAGTDDLPRIQFEVTDTGIGIEPGPLKRVFDPFIQADDSTTRQFGGTGLGLAIVKQLVEMMDGEVGVDSTPGHGSRFWFTVPLRAGVSALLSQVPGPALTGKRLLAVDDNDTNRKLIEQLARRWEMPVTTVSGGQEALVCLRRAAAQGTPFDCAAIDMNMPDMNGIELAREMDRDQAFPTPALVMLTSTFGQRQDAREAGIEIYMTKPVRRARLQTALADALGIHSQRQQAPTHRNPDVGSSPLILIAEDNDVNKTLAVKMLKRRGYHTHVVSNGAQALEALAHGSFAAVLMDCQMPELDGYNATGELRRREVGARRTPVIAMTANALRSDRSKCLASGMDDYISKPIQTTELDRVLVRWAPRTADTPGTTPQSNEPTLSRESPLDRAAVQQLRSELGSDELMRKMVDLFGTHTPRDLATIRRAINEGHPGPVIETAHKLKGSCATLAAPRVAELCQKLIAQVSRGSFTGAMMRLDQIEVAFRHAHSALLEECGTAASHPRLHRSNSQPHASHLKQAPGA
jgi:PAS domain S-box-containing protein